MILSSTGEGPSRRTRRAHSQFSQFIKGPSASQPQHASAVSLGLPPTPTAPGKGGGKQKATAAEPETSDLLATGAVSAPVPRKRRKAVTNPIPETSTEMSPPVKPTPDPSESISAQSHHRTTRSSRRRAGPSTTTLPTTPDPHSRSRKVILRVTQPENALDRFLEQSSEPFLPPTVGLDGKTNASLLELEAHAKAASILAEKRAEFRRKGWYLPLDRNGERKRGPPEEPERFVNTWDIILEAVGMAYRPNPSHLAVTKQICEAVKARAEVSLCGKVTQGRLVRGTAKAKGSKKQRDSPETALRKKLARETVDVVVDQWKRVVLVGVMRVFWVAWAHA